IACAWTCGVIAQTRGSVHRFVETIRAASDNFRLPRWPSGTVQRLLDHLRSYLRARRLLEHRSLVETNPCFGTRPTRNHEGKPEPGHGLPTPNFAQRSNHAPVS